MFHYSKSPETFNNSTINLTVLNKNILYLTHELDAIKRMLSGLITDISLQKQVTDYFDGDSDPNTPPNEDKEPD